MQCLCCSGFIETVLLQWYSLPLLLLLQWYSLPLSLLFTNICCSGIHSPLSFLFTSICCTGIHSSFHFFGSDIHSPFSLLFTIICCSGIHSPLSLLFTSICCSGIHSPFHFFCSGISLLLRNRATIFHDGWLCYQISTRSPRFLGQWKFSISFRSFFILATGE